MLTNLTKKQIEKIQFDEALIYLDYGTETERILAPTRGGGEFTANAKIRDIEFDGKSGKTAGTQVIEEQDANLKANSLCISQEDLALAIPGCRIEGEGDDMVIKNPKNGVIPESAYLKNITAFMKLLGGKYKKVTIYTPMHEAGLAIKATPKGEAELAFDFSAHYKTEDLDGDLWEIHEVTAVTAGTASQANTVAENDQTKDGEESA